MSRPLSQSASNPEHAGLRVIDVAMGRTTLEVAAVPNASSGAPSPDHRLVAFPGWSEIVVVDVEKGREDFRVPVEPPLRRCAT